MALLLLLRRPRQACGVALDNWLILVVFALPLISVFWSEQPGVSLRRAIALAMTGVYCLYIATRLSPDEFLRRLLLALFIGGVASILYTVLFPGVAIEHSAINTGSWKGVYGHKAILGRIAAVAVAVSLYVRPRHRWEQAIRWASIAIFLFLSYKSQSRASWLMILASLGFAVIFVAVRSPRLSNGIKLAVAAIISFSIVAGVIAGYSVILSDLGRTDTFSGRTSLWRGAIAVAMATHPYLGAGYRAFWTETGAAGVREYIMDWAGLPTHGHNGYLDVWLEMGIAGLVVFVAFVFTTVVRVGRRVIREPEETVWSALSIFIFIFILNNASVTVAFKHTDIAWIFAVLAFVYARSSVTARQPATSGRFAVPATSPAPLSAYAFRRVP
ncbi:MAG TPA: O-antigen ligase family protein [Rhizomicrobium sp.]|nr:O-antigen ligase family protein [Rhizomicrobium sp.]